MLKKLKQQFCKEVVIPCTISGVTAFRDQLSRILSKGDLMPSDQIMIGLNGRKVVFKIISSEIPVGKLTESQMADMSNTQEAVC